MTWRRLLELAQLAHNRDYPLREYYVRLVVTDLDRGGSDFQVNVHHGDDGCDPIAWGSLSEAVRQNGAMGEWERWGFATEACAAKLRGIVQRRIDASMQEAARLRAALAETSS